MNEKLNFHDLVGLLSDKAGITKKDAENFLREFFDLTTNALLEDKQVKIKNLGTFKIVDVNDRESVDVRTGERVVIPSHSKVSFVPDPALSKVVNEPFAMFEAVEIQEEAEVTEVAETEAEVEKGLKDLNVLNAQDRTDDEPKNPDSDPIEPGIPLRKKKKKKRRKNRRGIINFVIVVTTILIFAASYFILQKYDGTEDDFQEIAQEEQPKRNFSEQNDDTKLTSDSTTNKNIVENTPEDTIINSIETSVTQPEVRVKQINNNDNSVKQSKETEKQPETSVKKEPQKNVQYTVADGVKKRKIAEGERLTLIALQEYGSKDFWVYLYEENKSIIKNPGNVVTGTVITIPPASKYGIDKNNPESIKRAKELQKSMK